jgi:hypothetical protein
LQITQLFAEHIGQFPINLNRNNFSTSQRQKSSEKAKACTDFQNNIAFVEVGIIYHRVQQGTVNCKVLSQALLWKYLMLTQ